MAEETSLLQQAFAETGTQLDRIIDAYERKREYPYYIKFSRDENYQDTLFYQWSSYNNIDSVVWKINSSELNDYESNCPISNSPFGNTRFQYYYGYFIDCPSDNESGPIYHNGTFEPECQAQAQNGTFPSNYCAFTVRDGTITISRSDRSISKLEFCDASEF